jgi:hypothetical protein
MPTPNSVKTLETIYSAIPVGGPYFAAFLKFLEITGNFDQADPVARAIQLIEEQLQQLKHELDQLQQRVNALAVRVGNLENQNRVQRLSDLRGQIESLGNRIATPPDQLDQRKLIALDAGLVVDHFLDELDLWNWTDFSITATIDDYGHPVGDPQIDLMPADFKVMPALPIYAYAVMTWLLAIELDTSGNLTTVLERYGDRLRRHLAQNSVRDGWTEASGAPLTFPENVMSRITCRPVAQHQFALQDLCAFTITCENVMRRNTTGVREVSVLMPAGDDVACTVNADIGVLDERDIEDSEGNGTFSQIARALQAVLNAGTLRTPFVGVFAATPVRGTAFIYDVEQSGNLLWHRQQADIAPGSLGVWEGPRVAGTGWNSFKAVYPAGGNAFYALSPDGVLHWYRHDGFNEGSQQWTGPVQVGHGWGTFLRIISASDGVLYAIAPDGKLFWYRHNLFRQPDGENGWDSPRQLGTGWNTFKTVFSVGGGVLYAVDNSGNLQWYRHTGFGDGSPSWDGPRQVGNGWQNFKEVFGVSDGVIFAVKPDGTVLWYRHDAWQTGGPIWLGPVIAATGFTGSRQFFPLMPSTPTPPH